MSSEPPTDRPAILRLLELCGLIQTTIETIRAVDGDGRAAIRLTAIAAEAAAIRKRLRAQLILPVPD